MRDFTKLNPKVTDCEHFSRVVVDEVERILHEAFLVEGPRDRPKDLSCAGRQVKVWLASLALRPIRQAVRVRHQVKNVIAMVVADHDCVNIAVVEALAQLAKNTASAIHKYFDFVGLNEVAATSSTCVLPGWRTADNCYTEYWEGLFEMNAETSLGHAAVRYWETLLRCTT